MYAGLYHQQMDIAQHEIDEAVLDGARPTTGRSEASGALARDAAIGFMTAPSASVVITNYNYARYLRESIDSALSQTLDNVEVIVVDDGSTDESRSIIDSYGEAIRPVLKENGGQTSAINAGVRHAAGDFVVCLDADDTLSSTTLADAAERFDPTVSRVFWLLWKSTPMAHELEGFSRAGVILWTATCAT